MSSANPLFVRLRSLGGPLSALLSVAAAGCYYGGDAGLPPLAEGFYYPTGLVVSPGRSALYVANSDFDLEYSGGTVQAVDSVDLRKTLGALLAGIRCTEGNAAACVTYSMEYGMPAPTPSDPSTQTSLDVVCNAIPVSPGATGAAGAACTVPSDCTSGLCIDNACYACTTDADCGNAPPPPVADAGAPAYTDVQCFGYGKCDAGVCMLSCNTNTILTPSMCTGVAPQFAASGTIGAFASGAVLALNPNTGVGGARLFVPVRGDPFITWFDVGDDCAEAGSGTCKGPGGACSAQSDCCTASCDTTGHCGFLLYCGQSADQPRCDDDHRIGVDPYDNLRDMSLPVEPVGLDVSSDGTEIVTAHNTAGNPAIGLTLNVWPTGPGDACDPHAGGTQVACPVFEYYLSGSASVANGPTEVARVPAPALAAVLSTNLSPDPALQSFTYQQGFMVTYDLTPEVDIYRANLDDQAGASPSRPFLTRAAQIPITVNADGKDSRGLVIDPTARQACETGCNGDVACLTACIDIPLPTYIANRLPASLLLGQVQTTVIDSDIAAGTGSSIVDTLVVYGQTPLSLGPSKVALGTALDPDGNPKRLVFAVTFDTRKVYMYDPTAQTVVAVVETGRGPHAIAFDVCTTDCPPGEDPHAYLYVGHFTDSYIGVVDLDMRHPETFGTMFASIGAPLPPLESQ